MNTKVILEKDNKEKVTNKEMIEVSELVATIQDTQDQLDEIEENLKAKFTPLVRRRELSSIC